MPRGASRRDSRGGADGRESKIFSFKDACWQGREELCDNMQVRLGGDDVLTPPMPKATRLRMMIAWYIAFCATLEKCLAKHIIFNNSK